MRWCKARCGAGRCNAALAQSASAAPSSCHAGAQSLDSGPTSLRSGFMGTCHSLRHSFAGGFHRSIPANTFDTLRRRLTKC